MSDFESSEYSSSETQMNPVGGVSTNYEKQRECRIAQNKARMEALGLQRMANRWMNVGGKKKSKSQVKNDKEDVDYEPDSDDEDDDDLSDGSSDDRSIEVFNEKKKRKEAKDNINSRRQKVALMIYLVVFCCALTCIKLFKFS